MFLHKALLVMVMGVSVCSLSNAQSSPQPSRPAGSTASTKPPIMNLKFRNTEYVHRGSTGNEHTFAPRDDNDTKLSRDLITITVHGNLNTEEQVHRLSADMPTQGAPLAILDLPGNNLLVEGLENRDRKEIEIAYRRSTLHDGAAVVVVYSHREYGPAAATAMNAWRQAHQRQASDDLMQWSGLPRLAALRRLSH